MELLIAIAPILIVFVIGYVIISIQDWITDMRFYRKRHLRELKRVMRHPEFFSRTHDVSADEIKKAMDIYKASGVTTTLSTGEVEILGPGTITFGEEMNEAERLLKEANNRTID